jgi:hypothetical protein
MLKKHENIPHHLQFSKNKYLKIAYKNSFDCFAVIYRFSIKHKKYRHKMEIKMSSMYLQKKMQKID